MLYPNSQTNHLSHDLFKNPTCEYRSTPFWAWNGKLDSKRLSEQIQIFRQMGFGGFHMHVSTGMSSPYLDKEFMEHITHCIEEAKAQHMLAWLYDEDRWPSGTAEAGSPKSILNIPENPCFSPQCPTRNTDAPDLPSRNLAAARKISARKMAYCWGFMTFTSTETAP